MNNTTDLKSIIRIEVTRSKQVAFFLGAILFYLLALILWKQNDVDNSIVLYFNFIYSNDFFIGFFKSLSAYGMPFITLIYAFLIYWSAKRKDLFSVQPLFFLIIVSFALTTFGGALLKELIGRERPVIALAEQIAINYVSPTSSFPSGHSSKSMALALPLVLLVSQKSRFLLLIKIFLLSAAVLVCFSRVALQAHFLSDVFAGIGTALFFIPLAVWLANQFFAKLKMDENKLTQMTKRLLFVFIAFTAILCYL